MHACQAVIFDFDGVIVNTEPLHFQAYQRALAPLSIPLTWEHYFERYIGFDDRDALRAIFRDQERPLTPEDMIRLIADKAHHFQCIIRQQAVTPFPGILPLIHLLDGVKPLAICSGALREDILPILKQLQIEDSFDVMVTADDVPISKPSPIPYQKCFDELCRKFPGKVQTPDKCLAIEDTPAGVEAARGAGLNVLALAHTYPAEKLRKATHVIETLGQKSPEDFARLIAHVIG